MPLGQCIFAETRCNWYLHDINICSLSKEKDEISNSFYWWRSVVWTLRNFVVVLYVVGLFLGHVLQFVSQPCCLKRVSE
jgi:hypothetical protein